jgi:putative translation initiation factor aIF-2 beta subunit
MFYNIIYLKMQNIGGNCNDEFYRYKMSVLGVEYEGKNQNTRTIIKNFINICDELRRDPDLIEKYIGYQLNLRTKIDKIKLVVHSNHDRNVLQNIINGYIKDYVLCRTCHNPETSIVNNSKIIALTCLACGRTNEILNKTKINKKYNEYLLKYINSSIFKISEATPSKPKKQNELEDPIIVFTNFLNNNTLTETSCGVQDVSHNIYSELYRIKKSREYDDDQTLRLLIKVHIQTKINNISDVLKFFNYSHEMVLSTIANVLIELNNEKFMVTILEDLRDELIDEIKIKEWIRTHNQETIMGKILVKYAVWLNNAEEE